MLLLAEFATDVGEEHQHRLSRKTSKALSLNGTNTGSQRTRSEAHEAHNAPIVANRSPATRRVLCGPRVVIFAVPVRQVTRH